MWELKKFYIMATFTVIYHIVSALGDRCYNKQIRKLQKLQNNCIHLIDICKINLTEKFRSLRILNIKEIISLELAKIGFKLLRNELPNKIVQTISSDQNLRNLRKSHSYHTRNKSLLNLPKVTNNKY